jgi:hypothetical protein
LIVRHRRSSRVGNDIAPPVALSGIVADSHMNEI